MDSFPIKANYTFKFYSQQLALALLINLMRVSHLKYWSWGLLIVVFVGCGRTPEGFVDPELESNIERLSELPITDPFHFEVQKYLLNASKSNTSKNAITYYSEKRSTAIDSSKVLFHLVSGSIALAQMHSDSAFSSQMADLKKRVSPSCRRLLPNFEQFFTLGFAKSYPVRFEMEIDSSLVSNLESNIRDKVMVVSAMADSDFLKWQDPEFLCLCQIFGVAGAFGEVGAGLYLYGEQAKLTKDFESAFFYYVWSAEKYPNEIFAGNALFQAAFLLEDVFKDIDLARKFYKDFLDRYPYHSLVDEAKFLFENTGKYKDELSGRQLGDINQLLSTRLLINSY